MARAVSAERKAAYYAGMGVLVVGIVVFVSTGLLMMRSPLEADTSAFAVRGLLGMGLIVAGRLMMSVGARGLAGSGVVLDPRRAREDLEPYARMAGGLAKDALDEAGLAPRTRPVVLLECASCSRRNEADARFCQGCGRAL